YVDTMEGRAETVYWNRLQRQSVETNLDNGNRFLIGMMDTIVHYNETQLSAIYATFLLDSNGILIKDSLYNLTPDPIFPINQGFLQDTIYNVGNICKLSTGEVVVAGSMETFNMVEDNSLILFLVKYSADGEFLWRKHYNPFEITGALDLNRIWVSQVHEDKDGGILLNGKISYLFDSIAGYPDVYTASGYLLKLDKDGCYNGDCDGGLLLDTDDVLVSSGLDFKLFPNPVSDILNIQYNEEPDYELKIMTSDGRIQYAEQSVKQTNKEIETKDWPQGIYFVLVQSNNKMAVKTINVVH
ncbi:MAG TPA: T9SS type A sorting domain-containing protein, partial [Saprospiraceae bacterium]|nr:T9SS type A sorting domain-containing protein [Saprospiraceae bacterium]